MKLLESQILAKIPLQQAIDLLETERFTPPEEFNCSGPVEEMAFLYSIIRRYGGPVLEQGAYAGGSTRVMHKALKDFGNNQRLYSVDVYHRLVDRNESLDFRIPITGNARRYIPPESVRVVFEDTDHTRLSTLDCLARGEEAGARVMLIHDINAETLKSAPMALEHTCRAGALEFFNERPEFQLYEIECLQGFFCAFHGELIDPFRGLSTGGGR